MKIIFMLNYKILFYPSKYGNYIFLILKYDKFIIHNYNFNNKS